MGAKSETPLAAAVACAGERESLLLRRALTESGINHRQFARWTAGHGEPVLWVKHKIADALGVEVDELWPKSAGGDSARAPWRLPR
jgi:hypothetical protein